MKRAEYERQAARALELFARAGIVLTEAERQSIEVADFGLGRVERVGLQLIVYVNTERVCAKEMALLPGQVCPEHMHVPTGGQAGKEETFRCRYGEVLLYVSGSGTADQIHAPLPETVTSVYREIVLHPGEQYTILPGTLHWFCGGPEGAVVSEFSTHSTDETDEFTDPAVVRAPQIEDEAPNWQKGVL